MRRTLHAPIAAVLTAIGIVIVGCGSPSSGTGAASGSLSPSAHAQLERERAQAKDALDRWAAAVARAGGQPWFSIVGEKTGQVGDWEEAIGSNNKVALVSGQVQAATELPDAVPEPAEVRWDDGTVRTVPLISARQALLDLQANGQPCGDCTPLLVTGGTLSSASVISSRGPASVPVWEFTVEGSTVRITRVAVALEQTVTVSPPARDPDNPPVGLSIYGASGSIDERDLEATFIGAPDPASEVCGADYEAEAVESSLAVVVIVIEHPNPTPTICPAIGATRTAIVRLAQPLDNRAVLEVVQGLPVPVTLTR